MKQAHIVITIGIAILLSVLISIALGLSSGSDTKPAKDSTQPVEELEPVMNIAHTNIYRICIDDRLFLLTKSTYSSSEATLTQVFSAYGVAADCWEKKGAQ